MKNILLTCLGVALVASLSISLPAVLFAQTTDANGDPASLIVGWVCSNQDVMKWLLGFLAAHGGASVLSATLKKFGITEESLGPVFGKLVTLIRIFAVDAKPPEATVVANAATILAKSDSTAANATAPAVAQAAAEMKSGS